MGEMNWFAYEEVWAEFERKGYVVVKKECKSVICRLNFMRNGDFVLFDWDKQK